jgi:recombination protein RecR
MHTDPIQRLILELGRLPGIGERTAARLAFYIIKASSRAVAEGGQPLSRDLAHALIEVSDKVGLCKECQNLCAHERCAVCTDPARDRTVLCVVEGVADVRAIESTGSYRGIYFVLHGALAPLDGIGPEELKLGLLVERVQQNACREVIMATNADVEGDATALYLAQLLRSTGVGVSRIASGIPLGGELEYIDHATLSRALSERRSVY